MFSRPHGNLAGESHHSNHKIEGSDETLARYRLAQDVSRLEDVFVNFEVQLRVELGQVSIVAGGIT